MKEESVKRKRGEKETEPWEIIIINVTLCPPF